MITFIYILIIFSLLLMFGWALKYIIILGIVAGFIYLIYMLAQGDKNYQKQKQNDQHIQDEFRRKDVIQTRKVD